MTFRLTGGVTPGPDHGVWFRDPAGEPAPVSGVRLPPGTPVVVGPREASPTATASALEALERLVATAGIVAAAAEIELGAGFRSSRSDGGAGDRRDGALAALAVPGLADRLGNRLSTLVALFGPAVTRRLGAAAQVVIEAKQWSLLRYAVAASEVLGPEQLVELLQCGEPEGARPFAEGLASVTGRHLRQILADVPGPRRLRLLVDLWDQVCTYHLAELRRERLSASQGKHDRTEVLRARYERYVEDELRARVAREVGPNAGFMHLALWTPPKDYWTVRADRLVHDVLAAAVLARLAVSTVDLGVDAAIAAHWTEIDAIVDDFSRPEASMSAKVIPGFTGLPARPSSHLRDIHQRVLGRLRKPTADRTFELSRLALARDYGTVMMWEAESLAYLVLQDEQDHLKRWFAGPMAQWRQRLGYLSPQRAHVWDHPWLLDDDTDPGGSLQQRLSTPDATPEQVETVGDMLWYAELADALAQLRGRQAARVQHRRWTPEVEFEDDDPPDPLVPAPHSIPLAVAATAQLQDLGGMVPRQCRTWPELVTGLVATTAIAESLTGRFIVSPELMASDGAVLPGTTARIELAQGPRQLADWAAYMGNCIAGTYYSTRAVAGRVVLLALRDENGVILSNVELVPTLHGWRLAAHNGRFNAAPDPLLTQHLRTWLKGVQQPTPVSTVDRSWREARVMRVSPAQRTVAALGAVLQERLTAAFTEPGTVTSCRVLAQLAPGNVEPDAALTALRRMDVDALAEIVKVTTVQALWEATSDRPLARVIATLDEKSAMRLRPMLADEPLPGSLRPLARLPLVQQARTRQVVAVRLRSAYGVLIGQDDPELAQAVVARPHAGLLRAAALAITSRGGIAAETVAVNPPRKVLLPGYPASSLRDEWWQSSWPDAIELGGDPVVFWERLAEHGLLLPVSWLVRSWPVLWAQAHQQ